MMKFIVQGFELKMADGSLVDVCTFILYAKNKKQAIEKARTVEKKANYRITQVEESADVIKKLEL